jgi:hypothetical protein
MGLIELNDRTHGICNVGLGQNLQRPYYPLPRSSLLAGGIEEASTDPLPSPAIQIVHNPLGSGLARPNPDSRSGHILSITLLIIGVSMFLDDSENGA